jgi:hypothetical protein
MRRAGSASPDAIMADRTRSRASDTALSGRPTMVIVYIINFQPNYVLQLTFSR